MGAAPRSWPAAKDGTMPAFLWTDAHHQPKEDGEMPSSLAGAAATSTALSAAFLAAAVYALVQWIIKPLIVTYWLPQDNPYQDNATRAAGFIVAYVLTLLNTAVQQPLTWSLAWSLLPTAAGIYASSALVYHISTPGAPSPAPTPPPLPAPQPATPLVGTATEVQQIMEALTALGAALASGHAAAGSGVAATVPPEPAASPVPV